MISVVPPPLLGAQLADTAQLLVIGYVLPVVKDVPLPTPFKANEEVIAQLDVVV